MRFNVRSCRPAHRISAGNRSRVTDVVDSCEPYSRPDRDEIGNTIMAKADEMPLMMTQYRSDTTTLPGLNSPLRMAPATNAERMYALDEAWNARDGARRPRRLFR